MLLHKKTKNLELRTENFGVRQGRTYINLELRTENYELVLMHCISKLRT